MGGGSGTGARDAPHQASFAWRFTAGIVVCACAWQWFLVVNSRLRTSLVVNCFFRRPNDAGYAEALVCSLYFDGFWQSRSPSLMFWVEQHPARWRINAPVAFQGLREQLIHALVVDGMQSPTRKHWASIITRFPSGCPLCAFPDETASPL